MLTLPLATPLPLATLQLWLTPLWMLSLGVTAGLALLLVLYGLLWVVNRGAAGQAWAAISESVLLPIFYLGCAMAVLAVVAAPQMPTDDVLQSIRRLRSAGVQSYTQTVPPQTIDSELAVDLVADEVVAYEMRSDQDVRVSSAPDEAYSRPTALVLGGEPYQWDTKSKTKRGLADRVETLYLTNDGDAPAEVNLAFTSEVQTPEVRHLPITAASFAGIFLLYLAIRWLAPNVSNIAAATAKEAVAQPLFLLLTAGAALALVAFIYVPYNTFGEDVKMLKDSGLSTIMIFAILLAVWTASVSIAEEIEGKTALTLLSKPISRRQFILGKYLGILWAVLLMFVLLGAVLMATVSYKVVYDARESSNPTPDWQLCHAEAIGTTPGLVLAFFEAAVLTSISVAISTRLPMLPNLLICGTIYVLGHLTPLVVQSSIGENQFVAFFGRLVSVVLPMLDHLNIQAAIAAGQQVPMAYLGWAGLYSLAYIAVAMLLALILFEDRDLA